jgi:RNA polymerase sigma-70 factor (ECF subfamily)
MPEAPTGVLTPDDTLVQLSRAGDAVAREELFRRHFGVAYRVAYRHLGHEEDARDAVQDGMLKAITHLDDFDGRSEFRTWLVVIVSNAALDVGRRRGRRSARPMNDGENLGIEAVTRDDPAHGLYREDLRRILQRALLQLSPPIRSAFILFAEAGLSYKEIAGVLKIPQGTVMSRINAARKKLQKILSRDRIDEM